MTNSIDVLLGIIYGINYDGVINEKEIGLLSDWIGENKNHKAESIRNVVELIEEILEDGVVTEEERKRLIVLLESYQTSDLDVYRSYHILNGIIEGIASDQVINYDEAINLKQWLAKNAKLEGRYVYDKSKEIIEDVLQDDFISEKEHDQLIQTFTDFSRDFKNSARIDEIKKKITNQENIGMDIINLVDNKDLIDVIHLSAVSGLKKILSSYSGMGDKKTISTIFLSLALIALNSYNGRFYPHVEDQYGDIYQYHSPQRINAIIRELIVQAMPRNGDYGGRIINYVMMNCLVPQHYLPEFFVFLFDIYRLNFGFTLTDSVYDDLVFVYDGLKDKLSDDTDDLELNVTNKTYKLTKATKCVIQDENGRDAIIQLSKELLEIIEQSYWDDYSPTITNSYYKYGYEEWQRLLEENEADRSKRRAETKRARWTPILSFENGEIWLNPPVHNIHDIENYHDVCIKVYCGDSIIYEDTHPEMYEIIGGFQVHPKRVKLDDPLNETRYVLYDGDRILYDSQDKLERQFILFDANGNELKNNRAYNGTVNIVHNIDPVEYDVVIDAGRYKVSPIGEVNDETIVYLGEHVISFTEEMKPGIEGMVIPRQYLRRDNGFIPIYREIRNISFESNNEPDSIGIRINDQRRKLNELLYSQRKRGALNHYQVELDIDTFGVFDISAFNIQDNKTLRNAEFSIAYDPLFAVETLQIDDDQFLVDVKSGLAGSVCLELDVEKMAKLSLPLNDADGEVSLSIDTGVAVYRVDSLGWNLFNTPLWIGDINTTSELEVKGYEYDTLKIKDRFGCLLDEIPLKENNGVASCQIGSIVSYKTEHDYIVLEFYGIGGLIKRVNCYNKCLLDWNNTSVSNDPTDDVININAAFLGKGKVGYRITNRNEKIVLENQIQDTSRQLSVRKLHPLKPYFLHYFEKNQGFSLTEERELGMLPLCSYTFEDLVGKIAKIPCVEYEQYSTEKGALERREWNLKDTFVSFSAYVGHGMFEGCILRKKGDRFWKVKGAENVEIEYLAEPETFKIELAITHEQDGLLLDFERDSIHMNYDDPKAVDVYSYVAELKGAHNG